MVGLILIVFYIKGIIFFIQSTTMNKKIKGRKTEK